MDEFIKKLFSRENILAIISIAAFVMSSLTWLSTLRENRKRISIEVKGYAFIRNACLLYLFFINKSRIPLSITRITLLMDNEEIDCRVIPQMVRDYDIEGIHKEFDSIELPINIPSLGANAGHVIFVDCPDMRQNQPKSVSLELYTNRGKPKEYVLSLDKARCLSKTFHI